MNNTPPNQHGPSDLTSNLFWLLTGVTAGLLLLWFFHQNYFVTPMLWLRYHELKCLVVLSNIWNSIAHIVHLPISPTEDLFQLQRAVLAVDPKAITFAHFSEVNSLIGDWLRWPTIAILLILAAFAYSRHSTTLFRHVHNMASLKSKGAENWPQIQPTLSLNLIKEDLNKGPWAMAASPLDFCKRHKIITTQKKEDKIIWTVQKGPATRLFALQLGPLWKDIFNLPIHVKALIVIFITRAERKPAVANQLLRQISASAASGKLDFTGVDELLIEYSHSKLLQWLRPRHAYLYTMMATLLELARAGGVLATAEFLWLKPVDRRLWYVLNSVGRQTAVTEVSGAFSHWRAEKALGRAMITPMVKEAVKALDACINDILYIADQEQWHLINAD